MFTSKLVKALGLTVLIFGGPAIAAKDDNGAHQDGHPHLRHVSELAPVDFERELEVHQRKLELDCTTPGGLEFPLLSTVQAAQCAVGLRCTSKDLEVDGARLSPVGGTGGCIECTRCEQVTANLEFSIVNPTGSARPTAGIIGILQETVPDDCEDPGIHECNIARCVNPGALPPVGGAQFFPVGTITYTCGSSLAFQADEIRLIWTDASANSDCSSFDECKDFKPKCDGPPTDITVATGIAASATAACKDDGTSNIDITTAVSGGQSPYTYLWSNDATSADLSNVPDGAYTVTVTDANGCEATASTVEQGCCVPAATCKQLPGNTFCFRSQIPDARTNIDDVLDRTSTCFTAAMTDSSANPSISGNRCVAPDGESVTITYTYTETNNGVIVFTQQCDETFTIEDTEPPVITEPADLTKECGTCDPFSDCFDNDPTVSDDCDTGLSPTGGTPTKDVTDCGSTGTFAKVWTAQDSCLKDATSKTQTLIYQDTIPPELPTACVDSTTVFGCADAINIPESASPGNANDQCAGTLSPTSSCCTDPLVDGGFKVERTFTYNDGCTTPVGCTFTYNVGASGSTCTPS